MDVARGGGEGGGEIESIRSRCSGGGQVEDEYAKSKRDTLRRYVMLA